MATSAGRTAPSPAKDRLGAALDRDEAGDRSQERNRSAVVDAVRGLAALMVLAGHAIILANRGTRFGQGGKAGILDVMLLNGVFIFFSLSGYLIAGPFLRALLTGRPLPRLVPYFVRRAARIYPAYWVALGAVLLLLYPAAGLHARQVPFHLLLVQNSLPGTGDSIAIYAVAWTLFVEVAFYVFVPIAALVLHRLHPQPWPAGWLAAVVAGAGLLSAAYVFVVNSGFDGGPLGTLAYIGPQTWVYMFCPGMIVAIAVSGAGDSSARAWVRRAGSSPLIWLVILGAAWLAAYEVEHVVPATHPMAFVAASGVVFAGAIAGGAWTRPVARILAPVGLISYGIYLWHLVVIESISRYTNIGPRGGWGAWAIDLVLVLAGTLPLAAASWFGIERPFIHRAALWARGHAVRAA